MQRVLHALMEMKHINAIRAQLTLRTIKQVHRKILSIVNPAAPAIHIKTLVHAMHAIYYVTIVREVEILIARHVKYQLSQFKMWQINV